MKMQWISICKIKQSLTLHDALQSARGTPSRFRQYFLELQHFYLCIDNQMQMLIASFFWRKMLVYLAADVWLEFLKYFTGKQKLSRGRARNVPEQH